MIACTDFMNGGENLLLAEAISLNREIDVAMDYCFIKSDFETDKERLTQMLN